MQTERSATGILWTIFKLVEAPVVGQPGAEDVNQVCPIAMIHNVEVEAKTPDDRLPHTLPSGLVGPRCISTVSVGDTRCQSIFDTGSQVTTISDTFHSKYLSSFPIKPIHHLLEVEGAGGQSVPYLGYVEVPLFFPHSVTGTEERLTALALIVPECQFNSQIPMFFCSSIIAG